MTTSLAETRTPVRGPGGVVRWVGPRPGRTCIDCDTTLPDAANGRTLRCHTCAPKHAERVKQQAKKAARKAREQAEAARIAAQPYKPPTRFCGCGCLIQLGEDCPKCVRLWCRQVENEWNRRAS